jgi:protein tyrosine/serine phosphatase
MIPGLPPFNDADLILPRLWLGNARAAQNEEFLKQNNITVVFDCTKDIPFHPSIRKRYRVPVDDDLTQEEIRNMELWSFEIIYKLVKEYNTGATILVHCAAGMQRSAAVVAMFLIATQGMKWEQAIQYIRQRRPIAFYPSANFLQAIQGFEKTLEGMVHNS